MSLENTQEIQVQTMFEIETHIIIDKGNGEFTSILKSAWEEQQAQQQKLLGEINE